MFRYSIQHGFMKFLPLVFLLMLFINFIITFFIISKFIMKDINLMKSKQYYSKIRHKKNLINIYFCFLVFLSVVSFFSMPLFINHDLENFYINSHSDDYIISLIYIIIFFVIIPSRINYDIFLIYNEFKKSSYLYNLSNNVNKFIKFFKKLGLESTLILVVIFLTIINYVFFKDEIIKDKIIYEYYKENKVNELKTETNYSVIISETFGIKNKINFIPWSSTKEEVKILSNIKLIEEKQHMLKYLYSKNEEPDITIIYFFNSNNMLYKICATSEISDVNFDTHTLTYNNNKGIQCNYPSIIRDSKVIENLNEGSIKLNLLNEFSIFDENIYEKKPYNYEFDFYISSTLKQTKQNKDFILEITFFNPLSQTR